MRKAPDLGMGTKIAVLFFALFAAGCTVAAEQQEPKQHEVDRRGEELWAVVGPILKAPTGGNSRKCMQVMKPWTPDDLLAACRHIAIVYTKKYERKRNGRCWTDSKTRRYAGRLFQYYLRNKSGPESDSPSTMRDDLLNSMLKVIGDPEEPWAWRCFLMTQIPHCDRGLTDEQLNRLADVTEKILGAAEQEDYWVVTKAARLTLRRVRPAYVRAALADERIVVRFFPPLKRGDRRWNEQQKKKWRGQFLTKLPDKEIPPKTLEKMKHWRRRAEKLLVMYAATDKIVRPKSQRGEDPLPPLDAIAVDCYVRGMPWGDAPPRLISADLDYPEKAQVLKIAARWEKTLGEARQGPAVAPPVPAEHLKKYGKLSGKQIWARLHKLILVQQGKAKLSEEKADEIEWEMLPALSSAQLLDAARHAARTAQRSVRNPEDWHQAVVYLWFFVEHYPSAVSRETGKPEGSLPDIGFLAQALGSSKEPPILRLTIIQELMGKFVLEAKQQGEYQKALKVMISDARSPGLLRAEAAVELFRSVDDKFLNALEDDPAYKKARGDNRSFDVFKYKYVKEHEKDLLPETRARLRAVRAECLELAKVLVAARAKGADKKLQQKIKSMLEGCRKEGLIPEDFELKYVPETSGQGGA